MKWIKYAVPVVLFTMAVGFFYVSLNKVADSGGTQVTLNSQLIQQPLPAFSLPTLMGAEEVVNNEQVLGQKFLLNVWATWCISCAQEHPMLNKLQQQGVKIVGLNYKDDNVAALDWLAQKGNPYSLNLVDADGWYAMDLGVTGAPETFFVDAKGVVQHKLTGLVNEKNWQQQLQAIYEEMQ